VVTRVEPTRSAKLVIDLDALARNFALLRASAQPDECAAVVKADAYGLGLAPVARRLLREGCARFFVATAAEARELRALARVAAIYVLEGVRDGSLDLLVEARALPVLSSLEQVRLWRGRGRALLQVDTGMNRLGLSAAEVDELVGHPELLEGIEIELVLTHLACADEPEHPLNAEQLQAFEQLRGRLPTARVSIGNSAGTLIDADHRGQVVRPGIGLYGGNPFAARANPMAPVVSLSAPILQVREIETPQTVGYGATYAVKPPARLAVVGIGYADGYPRSAGNSGVAAIEGRRVPVVGRVSMDLLCVDVSSLPPGAAAVGTPVELIGETVTIDELAAAAGTISYEILTRLSPRLQREYRGA
jgi:alanine racemase